MKRLITACVLLVLLCAGCFVQYRAVTSASNQLAAAVSGQTDPAVLAACYADWSDRKPLLTSVIRHTEIDQIETLYRRAIQAADNHDLNETRLQVAELTSMLERLAALEAPLLRNIL